MSAPAAPAPRIADRVKTNAVALLAGLLFGAGLTVSRMIDPAKVIGFLDVFGRWDPSLALVMAAAVTVTFLGFRLAGAQGRPWLAPKTSGPARQGLDRRLIGGALLFGLGWGLAGYCPGPAVAGLALAELPTVIFVAAMLAGMLLYHLTLEERR
ncbi:DUF6691 family protein [Algihabitans albus]|uniref:DUF6691 family protein n=1 Tax=Algihabitans albus TaxID=2164067 RepID=UPI000E5CAF72|nr:DUF6691 family protein [Algihabitans albus]